jgi:hypothetical protein
MALERVGVKHQAGRADEFGEIEIDRRIEAPFVDSPALQAAIDIGE